MAGRPFTHGSPGYDAWMAAYDPLDAPPVPDERDTVSVICPVLDPPPAELTDALASVLAQSHRCELVIVDDGCTDAQVLDIIDRISHHPGVVVVRTGGRAGIAAASNRGIEASTGSIISFVDHDDVLRPDAVSWLVSALAEADIAYSDEDQLTPAGDRVQPFLKPAWSPLLLLGMNYVNHAVAVRRTLLDSLGGFDESLSGAQDHDLMLRAAERRIVVSHVPKVLYNWRQSLRSVAADVESKPWALDAARRAVNDALTRRSMGAKAVDSAIAGPYRFDIRFSGRDEVDSFVVASDTSTANLAEALSASNGRPLAISPLNQPLSASAVAQITGWVSSGSAAAACPVTRDPSGSIVDAGWFAREGALHRYGAGWYGAPVPFLEVAREVAAVSGPYLVVDPARALAVGGPDAALPLFDAIVELTARMAAAGGHCVADPSVDAVVAGIDGPTTIPFDDPSTTMWISPHVWHDGIAIAPPPGGGEERRSRLATRLHQNDPAA